MNIKRRNRKTKVGLVASDKMQKTVLVKVEKLFVHPLFKKRLKRSKKFKVHNEENKARLGDKVKIAETRPLSREKRWRVVEILERAAK